MEHADGRPVRAGGETPAPLAGACAHGAGVCARADAERALAHSLSLLRATLEATADGICVTNRGGYIIDVNQKFLDVWRMTREQVIRVDPCAALPVAARRLRHPERFLANAAMLSRNREMVYDDVLEFADGRVVEIHSQPRRLDGEVAGRVFSFRDVTARRRAEAQLAHQAFHDALTGLANRALFRDRLEHALARAPRSERLAVLVLDLDDFKTVNDSLGHAAGDALLRTVADRLRRATRGCDTVARLGGDEFAVLLEGVHDDHDGSIVVERVEAALRVPVRVLGKEVLVGASIGVAHAEPGNSADELLRNADVAMYRAKGAGKNCHAVFEPAMHAALLDRIALERDLRRAVDRAAAGMGESGFRLAYQPVVDIARGDVVGFEALLRWAHPTRGEVGPTTFVPIAEEMGLIVPLGRWALVAACRQLAAWAAAHPEAPPSVAVNLSGRQLEDDGLVDDLAWALASTGAPADRLTLEITETKLLRRSECVLRRLRALKALGVRLAVDDFGTGYSSLSYLHRFPVDVLKIDKSFVDTVAHGGSDAALARTIVALGETLGLRTVAEGVEEVAQRAALRALGCTLAQGFLFAEPLEPAAASGLVGASFGPVPAAWDVALDAVDAAAREAALR